MENAILEDIELLTSEGSFNMKDVRTISRDEDFFEQMKRIMGEQSWCFIDQKVIEHLKKEAGCFTLDCTHQRMNFTLSRRYISIEYSSENAWHRVWCVRTHETERCVCQDPEEVLFITME